jgi:CRISPR-associated protein Cas1
LYYSTNGSFYGKLNSTRHVNVARQRRQAILGGDADFCLSLAKRIIRAKIHNQTVVLRRYARTSEFEVRSEILAMQSAEKSAENCMMLDEALGFEGIAARSYYKGLAKLVVPEFAFEGRSRQPPKDPFNSMLSLGYTVLLYALYGAIEARGLNPYFGFMHRDKNKHPTLASDMMEEWRAIIVDSVVMSMVNGREIKPDNFYSVADKPGVFLDKAGFKTFIAKLEKKFEAEQRYLLYVDYPQSFRQAINMQTGELAKAIESGVPNHYNPIIIR